MDFVKHDRVIGLLHRTQNSLFVEWYQGAWVNHFDTDFFFRQLLSQLECLGHHRADSDDGYVVAGPLNGGLAEGHEMLPGRNFLAMASERAMFEDDYRVIIANSRLQQALNVRRARRHHD